MKNQFRLAAASGVVFMFAAAAILAIATPPKPAMADDCPNGGIVRFGVEPYDTAARLVPIYEKIGKMIGDKIGCKVEVYVATGYNAEIEAMRNGKLEVGEFGPLGYVLAHQVAKAEAVAAFGNAENKAVTYWASVVTYPSSGLKTIAEIRGHSFAFSDPASTSGHLFPAYGLRKAGIDPDHDINAIYAGSHTASFEALYNHKVDAAELNSEQLESAIQRGHYKEGDLVFLWKSDPIPTDPVAIRGDLPEPFKRKLAEALQHLDLMSLDAAERKIMVGAGITQLVPETDGAYDGIRDLVKICKSWVDVARVDPMLRLRGLSLRYPNGKLALSDFDLTIAAGEFVAVLGGNGSGKTTLLRCITRTVKPSAGEIRLGEVDLCALEGEKLRRARLALAMIWQHPSLVRRRSVLTNVATGALGRNFTLRTALGGLPGAELDAARSYLAEVGLANLAEQRAGTLSGGQAQRVAIARALAQRPKVLLADEPVASLDPEAAEDIMRLLQRLARAERIAVICVLHQVELAYAYADRVIGIKDGRMVFDLPRGQISREAVHQLYLPEAARVSTSHLIACMAPERRHGVVP